MGKKILMVDDDETLMYVAKDMLENYGFEVTLVTDSEKAFKELENKKFDLILLDINLPDETGFYVCSELRKVSDVPIIFASARTSENDKITGLDIGGDDYIEKPYSLRELLSRINALIRRTYGGKEDIITIGKDKNIVVDIGNRTVTRNGEVMKLALKEFDVLKYMCLNQNQTLSKEQILHNVWGAFSEAELATVAVHVRWLREKLEEDASKPTLITTVWGVGYRLEGN